MSGAPNASGTRCEEIYADHAVPHAQGGKTTLENGEHQGPLPERRRLVAHPVFKTGVGERTDSLRAVVESLESEDSYLNKRVGDLGGELQAMHETVTGLKGDVERLTDRLADPNRRRLEKARHALTTDSGRR